MIDASGFGIRVTLFASSTFPTGIDLTSFSDDTDPVDIASQQVRDKASGVNGDLIVWSKANPVPLTVAVLPNTDDDDNLQILAMNNRPARGRRPVQDQITAVVTYPNGVVRRFMRGALTDAMMATSVASSGRQKTKPYIFAFEDVQ